MPSSKKQRGRDRKAKKAAGMLPFWSWEKAVVTPNANNGCSHANNGCSRGCPTLTPFLKETYDAFAECYWEKAHGRTFDFSAFLKSRRLFGRDAETRSAIQRLLASAAANILVLDSKTDKIETSKRLKFSGFCALAIFFFDECNDGRRHTLKFGRKIRDLVGGNEAEVFRFLKKRIPCSCLDGMGKKFKHKPKMGLCFTCLKHMEYKTMFKCSSCNLSHYCSQQCQVAHWPNHREECKKIREAKIAST